jgi:hypothetical protein
VIRVQLQCKSGWHSLARAVGYNAPMSTTRHKAFVAILARIDEQIVESDALLLKSLTDWERHLVTDELAELHLERLEMEGKLQNER